MIIRKYLVDDINEALFCIKHELGDDAYIISKKQVRQPGIKGLFTNKKLEVTVGVVNPSNINENKLLTGDELDKNVNFNSIPVTQTQSQIDVNSLNNLANLKNLNTNSPLANSFQPNMYKSQEQSQSMSYYNKLFEEKHKELNGLSENIFANQMKDGSHQLNQNNNLNPFNMESKNRLENYNMKPTSSIMDLNVDSNYEYESLNSSVTPDRITENQNEAINNYADLIKQNNIGENKNSTLDELKKEIHEIKSIVGEIATSKPSPSYLDEILYSQDICRELCDEIKSNCTLTKDELMNKTIVKKYLRGVFSNIIKIYDSNISNKIVVVGPTGSGKTTTIAKLAGMLSLNLNKSVGLVTIDTFRVGAVEQLKMYADIMNIPYKYVTTLDDIRNVFDYMKSCEVVLVDTIGRSNKNIIHLNELNMFVQSIQSDEVTLVISAGMKQQDLDGFINSFKGIKFKNVIVTKLDETNSFGMFVNICYKTSLPISFVTVGQDVPLDIKQADKEEILNMILGE